MNERLLDAAVERHGRVVGVEGQANAGGFGSGHDAPHEAVHAPPDFGFGHAHGGIAGVDAPGDQVGLFDPGGVEGAQVGAGASAGKVAVAAPGLDVLVGVGHAEAAGDQRGALAAEDADRLAQMVDLARALGCAA